MAPELEANHYKKQTRYNKYHKKIVVFIFKIFQVYLSQKKLEGRIILTTKIGDINNKFNQEFTNWNFYANNL